MDDNGRGLEYHALPIHCKMYVAFPMQVLQPEDGGGRKKRLIIIGKKRLPSPERHEKYFGFVAGVAEKVEELLKELSPQDYVTKTQGDRHIEGARVAGEGNVLGFAFTTSDCVNAVPGGICSCFSPCVQTVFHGSAAALLRASLGNHVAGHYALVVKHRNQTYLAWELEVPSMPGEVQKDLRISKEGSLVVNVKVCHPYRQHQVMMR